MRVQQCVRFARYTLNYILLLSCLHDTQNFVPKELGQTHPYESSVTTIIHIHANQSKLKSLKQKTKLFINRSVVHVMAPTPTLPIYKFVHFYNHSLQYIYPSRACEQGLCNRGWCPYIMFIYVYVIARAGVIFGIYFTSCRYSGGLIARGEAECYFVTLPKTSGIYPRISRLPML